MTFMKFKKPREVFLSERFERAVALHVFKNMLHNTDVEIPLLMGVHGPSGEGKTFQVENILKKLGVKRFLISGGQLLSDTSGAPAALIRTMYIKAGRAVRGGECSLAALLINDVDTGLGKWGAEGMYGLNQQAVFGELMHLVDYPEMVETTDTMRIPIIITGNDFTKLYEPLVRAGRMEAFEWIPTLEERTEILMAIFPELTREQCRELITRINARYWELYPETNLPLSIAFYSHLRATLLDEDIWREVERVGLGKFVDNVIIGEEKDFSLGLSFERVLEKGYSLIRSGHLINHLKNSHPR